MAGCYSFDAWTQDDLALFERHYDLALAKLDGQSAKLISHFAIMKNLMLKYEAAEP